MTRVEKWVLKKQKEKGFSLIQFFLFVGSLFFAMGVLVRHLLYQLGIIKRVKGSLPIISVGNIVCGGTGKTEFVLKLVSDLGINGVAVLTRGYGSKKSGNALVQDIEDGDEPYLLSKRLKNAFVIRGVRREISVKIAEKLGAKICILDDGLQYIRLKKELQIVMIGAKDPFSRGYLPFGLRRERLSALKKADYIVIHGANDKTGYEVVKKSISVYTSAQFLGTTYLLDKTCLPKGNKVGVFCGIGNPELFIQGLKDLDLIIVKIRILKDHEKVSRLEEFVKVCKQMGADGVLCTEKDYVKLSEEEKKLVILMKVSMEVTYEKENYLSLKGAVNRMIERDGEGKG